MHTVSALVTVPECLLLLIVKNIHEKNCFILLYVITSLRTTLLMVHDICLLLVGVVNRSDMLVIPGVVYTSSTYHVM